MKEEDGESSKKESGRRRKGERERELYYFLLDRLIKLILNIYVNNVHCPQHFPPQSSLLLTNQIQIQFILCSNTDILTQLYLSLLCSIIVYKTPVCVYRISSLGWITTTSHSRGLQLKLPSH